MTATEIGAVLADAFFETRKPKSGARKGMKNVEVHVSEAQLAQLLAAAYQMGRDDAGQP